MVLRPKKYMGVQVNNKTVTNSTNKIPLKVKKLWIEQKIFPKKLFGCSITSASKNKREKIKKWGRPKKGLS